ISATFVYDADGNRVLGTVDGTTTIYIAGVYEYQAGATTHYYEGPTGNVALRRTGHVSNNGVFYLLGDHLGSTSVLVNQNGTLNSSNYYYPYGSNRGGAQSTLTAKRYTGQYHEEGLAGSQGLYYYGARWYDPQLARFAQADTIVPDPTSSHSYNRYMYVQGNPLKLVDPSGHFGMLATAAIGGAIGGAVGFGMYALNTARSGQAFDIKEAAVATGTMAVAGALIGTGFGAAQGLSMAAATAVTIGTSTGVGMAAGGAGYVAANTLTGSEFKTADFAISSA
ncbi:MAG: RHS repeat-associated core domain-containing protein, partial [Gammaproteobacteria bacterium]|nr:RHS repeat-associated core domain-containing protein [Gammaproteobacteria bacterium]